MGKFINQKHPNDDVRVIDLNCKDFRDFIDEIMTAKLVELAKSLTHFPTKVEDYWTRKQTAERLHITLPTLRTWTKTGRLKSYEIAGRVLYKPEEVDQALRKQTECVRK